VAVLERDGLRVRSATLGDFEVRPRAVPRLEEPVDVLFVASKATALGPALDRVVAEPGLVIPQLNGLDHLEVLRERFGDRVVAGTIRVESHRPAPGEIVHPSQFLGVEVASDDPAQRAGLEEVAADLSAAGVPAWVGESVATAMWSKLTRLVALATLTSAAGEPMGGIRADPRWATALEDVVREAAAVATAEGAPTDADQVLGELGIVHDDFRSSMQRDLEAGREPELDSIQGAVLRAAARHGIETPVLAELSDLIAERASVAAPRAA
jgi:2-dehydropantoate 2-reductase